MGRPTGVYEDILINRMVSNTDRMFMKQIYDTFDLYQNFKNQDEYVSMRTEWHKMNIIDKRFLMVIANVQNSSQKVWAYQINQKFDFIKINKNHYIMTTLKKPVVVFNLFDGGDINYYVQPHKTIKATSREMAIGKFRKNIVPFIIDYIQMWEKNNTDKEDMNNHIDWQKLTYHNNKQEQSIST